jgi:hypothetical protein
MIEAVYRKMWNVADEVAELEAQQFDKKPYADRLVINSCDGPTFKYDDMTRQQYKDQRRWGHLHLMTSMYIGSEEEEEINEKLNQ